MATKTVTISQSSAEYLAAVQANAISAQALANGVLTALLREHGILGAAQLTGLDGTQVTVTVPD